MKRNFQTLVVSHQLLLFATLMVQSATNEWLDPELRSFLGVESSIMEGPAASGTEHLLQDALWWTITLLSLLASVGVILFRRWGRRLFLVVTVASLLTVPLTGLYVDVGLTVMVASAAALIEGMIVALMYFSPLRKAFEVDAESRSRHAAEAQ